MLPSRAYAYSIISLGDGKYQFDLDFDDGQVAPSLKVDDIFRDVDGNRYRILEWNGYPDNFSNWGIVTAHYITEDKKPTEGWGSVYTEGLVDPRSPVYTSGEIFEAQRKDRQEFLYIVSVTWNDAVNAGYAEIGDYISDADGNLYEIKEFGEENDGWTGLVVQEADPASNMPTSGNAFLFRPTENFKLYLGGFITNQQLTILSARDNAMIDHYAGAGELGGGSIAAVFIQDVEAVDSEGIVGMKEWRESIPEEMHLKSAVSDSSPVKIFVGAAGGSNEYTPTITVNEEPVQLEETSTTRWFVGYGTINLQPGTTYVKAESSTGGTDYIHLAFQPDGPSVDSIEFGDYPGSQTELKENDQIQVTVNTSDEYAQEIVILADGANKTEKVLPVEDGQAVGMITISDKSGDQPVKAAARNELGTKGPVLTSSEMLVLNQTYPSITALNVNYPNEQLAFGENQSGSLDANISDFDVVVYESSDFNISDPNTYESTKSITNTHTGYVASGHNITITATRNANDATTTDNVLAKIATEEPTASISIEGNPDRLRSSPTGIDYGILINSTQQLIEEPSLNASIGGWQGDWNQIDDYTWKRDLRIVDNDEKGTGVFTSLEIKNLANITGNQITDGDEYIVGGFVQRTLTFPAFSRVAAIGSQVKDQTKTSAKIKGGNVLTRYEDNDQRSQGYYIADENADYDPQGEYLGLSDNDFAMSNTTGTLQALIEEEE